MAKRVKTKKGSIGKKALAAILAASMVLSSSAFSVLADGGVEPIDEPAATSVFKTAKVKQVAINIPDQYWVGDHTECFNFENINIQAQTDDEEWTPLDEWNRDKPQEGWTYEILGVSDKADTVGGSSTANRSMLYGKKPTKNEDPKDCAGPHLRVKMHYTGDADFTGSDVVDGDIICFDFLIEKLKLDDGENGNTVVEWKGGTNFEYNGQYQRPELTKVTVNPNGTKKGFDMDLSLLKVEESEDHMKDCETTPGSDTGYNQHGNKHDDPETDGVHEISVKPKDADNKNFEGEVGKLNIEVHQAYINSNLVAVKTKPVSERLDDRAMIDYIIENTSVRDQVLVRDNAVKGRELVYGKNNDYIICFPENGEYHQAGNNWVQGVPDITPGPHTMGIIVTNADNFLPGSILEVQYEVLPENSLERIAANADLSGFTDDNKDGVWESVYTGENQYPGKLTLKEGSYTLKEGEDYRVTSTKDWTDAKDYTLTIVGIKGDYAGQKAYIQAKIDPAPLWAPSTNGKLRSTFSANIVQSEREPETFGDVIFPTMTWNRAAEYNNNRLTSQTLNEGTDYTVEKIEDRNRATGEFEKLAVTGIGNFTSEWKNGTESKDYVVITRDDHNNNGPIKIEVETGELDLRDSSIQAEITTKFTNNDVVGGMVTIREKDIVVRDTSKNGNPRLGLNVDYEFVKRNASGSIPADILNAAKTEIKVPYSGGGTGTVQILGKSGGDYNYCSDTGHELTVNFTVTAEDFDEDYDADPIADIPYNGGKAIKKPTTRVYRTGSTVEYGSVEYSYAYADGTKIEDTDDITETGEYKAIITSTDWRYTGAIEVPFRVVGEDINTVAKAEIVGDSTLVYNGSEQAPEIKVTRNDGTPLFEGINYRIIGATNAGEAVAVIEGIDEYGGTIEVPFTISPASMEGATVTTAEKQAFTETPDVVVKIGNTTLTAGTDYDITSVTPSEDGKTATVTVTGKGNYTGTATTTFEIEESGSDEPTPTPPVEETIKTPTITLSRNISKKKKTFTVSTCKVPGATEWEVQYSLKKARKDNGDLKANKTKTYASNKAGRLYRKVITCNKSGKVYYVRVRAKVNGDWSEWSDTVEGLEQIKSR